VPHLTHFHPTSFPFGPPASYNGPTAGHRYPENSYSDLTVSAFSEELPTRNKAQIPPKINRPIYPKGSHEGRRAPSDTFDATETNQALKRRRALSPSGRENARQVRLKGACVRCSFLKTKVSKLAAHDILLTTPSAMPVDPVLLGRETRNAGLTFRAWKNGPRIDGAT